MSYSSCGIEDEAGCSLSVDLEIILSIMLKDSLIAAPNEKCLTFTSSIHLVLQD